MFFLYTFWTIEYRHLWTISERRCSVTLINYTNDILTLCIVSNNESPSPLLSDPNHFPFPLSTEVWSRTTRSSALCSAHTRLNGVDENPCRDSG